MNVKKIREDFPLLLANPDLTYLDSAATSQKPACVLRAEREFYECHNANPLRGLYELSENATKCYEDARKTVQHFIGAARPEEIIFTRNATESLNLIAYSYGDLVLQPGDELLGASGGVAPGLVGQTDDLLQNGPPVKTPRALAWARESKYNKSV